MSVTRSVLKSCCGGTSYVFKISKSVQKSYLSVFTNAGFVTKKNYDKLGLFYISKKGLTATAPFGATQIQVRCSNRSKPILDEFEKILTELVNA